MQRMQRMGAHCRFCPTAKEEDMLAVTSEVGAGVDDGDNGTVPPSVFNAEETGSRVGGWGVNLAGRR